MGLKTPVILGLLGAMLGSQAAACNLPDGAAQLLKSLDQTDRGLRELKLPKAKTDELSDKARQQLISNHIFLRDLDCSAARAGSQGTVVNRTPSDEELSVQRRIIRQNDEIINELRRRR